VLTQTAHAGQGAAASMGKAKKTRKFAEVKRMLNPKDLKPCALSLHVSAPSST